MPAQDKPNLAVMARDISYIREEVDDIKKQLTDKYVTRYEFDPIKQLVYGVVSLILIAVVGAVVGLVIVR